MNDMLPKIAKLLNQAENAGTEAEAAIFMAKAQELASIHSVDLARARHLTTAKERTIPVQRTIHIAERGTRGLRTLTDLYLGIAAANDVRCTIAHDATRVYAVGFAEDIDISEALFASLQVQMATAAAEFRKQGSWKGERVWSNRKFDWTTVTWSTVRLEFQDAYQGRVSMRLISAKREAESQMKRDEMERGSRPHIEGDDVSEHFKQWFFDTHGLDLDEDDSTAQEMRHGFLVMQHYADCGVVIPEDGIDWLAEYLSEYVAAVADQRNVAGTELVLASKREALDEAFAPALKRARGSYRGHTSGAHSAAGRAGGRAAGDRASLGARTGIGGTKGAISA